MQYNYLIELAWFEKKNKSNFKRNHKNKIIIKIIINKIIAEKHVSHLYLACGP